MTNGKTTVSLIKADVGSIAGHRTPRPEQMDACRQVLQKAKDSKLMIDFYVTHCGDDIQLLMTHTRGEMNTEVHKLAYDAFLAGTKVAKDMHLYAAGQDLL